MLWQKLYNQKDYWSKLSDGITCEIYHGSEWRIAHESEIQFGECFAARAYRFQALQWGDNANAHEKVKPGNRLRTDAKNENFPRYWHPKTIEKFWWSVPIIQKLNQRPKKFKENAGLRK